MSWSGWKKKEVFSREWKVENEELMCNGRKVVVENHTEEEREGMVWCGWKKVDELEEGGRGCLDCALENKTRGRNKRRGCVGGERERKRWGVLVEKKNT